MQSESIIYQILETKITLHQICLLDFFQFKTKNALKKRSRKTENAGVMLISSDENMRHFVIVVCLFV